MSKENVRIVRSMLEPFEQVNVAAVDWGAEPIREVLRSAYAPDVELRTLESGTGTGVGAVYRGHDGLIRYLQDWIEPFSEYRVEWLDYIEAGDRVLVPSRQRGTGSGSGVTTELELTHVYEVHDGLITRVAQYDTLDDARNAG
jgi:ketosteroid isomerase-like protein